MQLMQFMRGISNGFLTISVHGQTLFHTLKVVSFVKSFSVENQPESSAIQYLKWSERVIKFKKLRISVVSYFRSADLAIL